MSSSTIPTSVSLEGRLAADPVLQHTRAGRSFVRVRVEAEAVPVSLGDGQFADFPAVPCDLVVFGKAADRMTSRFRFGDRFVASGRVKTTSDGEAWFVARRIGHDAARTTYRVTRARRIARRGTNALKASDNHRPGQPADLDQLIVAGRILPDSWTA
ncbi:Single-strand binding protein family protein [Promicromonospora umidemergens]|uniref:Single-stranded DNA-binding protein n=3 Tax=Promicromonospora TaxID=43676 RepID=A0ABW4V9K9_9MICO|nr:single-stranded DNA-binding protein [Promicromonospora umidemergens]MCP2284921.1 Single-strand binding protein family protein [Promicromonospora umidemergens]